MTTASLSTLSARCGRYTRPYSFPPIGTRIGCWYRPRSSSASYDHIRSGVSESGPTVSRTNLIARPPVRLLRSPSFMPLLHAARCRRRSGLRPLCAQMLRWQMRRWRWEARRQPGVGAGSTPQHDARRKYLGDHFGWAFHFELPATAIRPPLSSCCRGLVLMWVSKGLRRSE